MGMRADIHNYEKILENTLSRLNSSNIHETNKKAIKRFAQRLMTEGMSYGRVAKYVMHARKLARMLGKPLLKASRADIEGLVRRIEMNRDYKDWTKHDYKVSIRKLYTFLKGSSGCPEIVAWIRPDSNVKNHMLPEELLTEEEVKTMVETARTPRDRALILTLYESGCRVGEILSLSIKNVQFDEHGAVLTVDGKTGMRRVRVIASAPALASWISIHPLKENLDEPLWINQGTRNRDKPLTYRATCETLRTVASKAGIKKRVYPYLFRHSRATHLANHLTEAQMKELFGWVRDSNMASVYVHLSGRDVDNALLKLHGLATGEKESLEEFKVQVCPRCKMKNSPESKFCNGCGLCLDVKTAMQMDEVRSKADKLMNELIKQPKVLDALVDAIERMNARS